MSSGITTSIGVVITAALAFSCATGPIGPGSAKASEDASIGRHAALGGGAANAAHAVVPNLVGLPLSEARREAARAGFRLGSPVWAVTPWRPGRVINQIPYQGADVGDLTTRISIALSTGLKATGRTAAEFRTTSGAAYCQMDTSGETSSYLVCWTPDDGFMVNLSITNEFGPASTQYRRRARDAYPKGFRTVGFGGEWSRGGIRCRSESSGLTCRNRDGGGFWLGRYRGFHTFGGA